MQEGGVHGRGFANTFVQQWELGKDAAHDWVVTHVVQEGRRMEDPAEATRKAEDRKDSYAKTRCEERGLEFVPLAMDTFGGVGVEASRAIGVAVAHARVFRGIALFDRTVSRLCLLQRLQIAVMRGVARQLLRRAGRCVDERRTHTR